MFLLCSMMIHLCFQVCCLYTTLHQVSPHECNVNIQDGAVVHTLYQRSKTVIGDNVSIGHNATVHGATIESNSLIGMGATVLDNAVVESGAIVAANALVTSGMRVEGGWIYAGVPAKKIKQVSTEQQKDIVERIANDYIMYASWYKE